MNRVLTCFYFLLSAMLGGQTIAYAAQPLSVYGQLPAFEDAALSPSGDRIAITGIVGDERRLVIIDNDANPILALPLGDVKVRGIYWIGDDRILIYKSNTANLGIGFTADKTELYSAIIVPLDGKKIWSVFQNSDKITGGVRGFYGVNQRGGKWYGYFGGITFDGGGKLVPYLANTNPILYEVDLDTGSAHKIGPRSEDGVHRRWTLGPEGAVNATLDYISRTGNWAIRNATGQKIATGNSQLGGVGLVGLGNSDGTLIYGLTDDESGKVRWLAVPLNGGVAKEILPDTAIEQGFVDRRSRRLIGYALGGDVPAYRFFDARQQKIIDATFKAFPGYAVSLVDWNDAFDKLIVRTEGQEDPQNWWLVDIKTGQARPLGQSYLIPAAEVGPIKMIRYKASDGTDIAGVLTMPPGRATKNLPVIVFPHGGPASHNKLGFDWWAQAFAARGYAVLQPNFRGSTGYGAEFERAGHGEWGRKMQTDISDGLAYLVREGIADPKRACIMGASFGGYAALAGVTLQQGIYRCAVSVGGISDVTKMTTTEIMESGGDPVISRSLRHQIGVRRDLDAVSPIRFVDSVTAPILLVHGKDDTIVHYEQSKDMAGALRRAGKMVEFVTLAGEDHWLSKGATRLAMLQSAVAFIEKHNPPDATVSP